MSASAVRRRPSSSPAPSTRSTAATRPRRARGRTPGPALGFELSVANVDKPDVPADDLRPDSASSWAGAGVRHRCPDVPGEGPPVPGHDVRGRGGHRGPLVRAQVLWRRPKGWAGPSTRSVTGVSVFRRRSGDRGRAVRGCDRRRDSRPLPRYVLGLRRDRISGGYVLHRPFGNKTRDDGRVSNTSTAWTSAGRNWPARTPGSPASFPRPSSQSASSATYRRCIA